MMCLRIWSNVEKLGPSPGLLKFNLTKFAHGYFIKYAKFQRDHPSGIPEKNRRGITTQPLCPDEG